VSKLDQSQEVIDLARNLGLQGTPVKAILDHCESQVDTWLSAHDEVCTIEEIERIVLAKSQMVFEEIHDDHDFARLKNVYAHGKGEFVLASMQHRFDDPATYGSLVRRSKASMEDRDRYVAVIDCRGPKLARRFFTRWHEIAHRLTTHCDKLELVFTEPAFRSETDPVERMMDSIASHIGFYGRLFEPVFNEHCNDSCLTLEMIETIRQAYCGSASFQATLFACQNRFPSPVVYIEATERLKAKDERSQDQPRLFEDDMPTPELRISNMLRNPAAYESGLTVRRNMRPPETSVVFRAFYGDEIELSATENLGDWTFSSGGSLQPLEVFIQSKKVGDRVFATIQPSFPPQCT